MKNKSTVVIVSLLMIGFLLTYQSPIANASNSAGLSRCEDPLGNPQFPCYPPGYCPGPADEPIPCPHPEPKTDPNNCRENLIRCPSNPCDDPAGICPQPRPEAAGI